MNKKLLSSLIAVACAAGVISTANAGITVYKEGEKYVKIGGRIQLQYHSNDPDNGRSTDEVFFRRLRPYIEGSLIKDWRGKFQFDLGKAEGENEIAIKDAYAQYRGFNNMKLTIGNANFPFSREFLTSSKKQQLVERTFVGDHNYGTPDRNIGLHLTGYTDSKFITWGASIASASIDPSNSKLDFDTPVNRNTDFEDGWMFGGRADFHLLGGGAGFKQGDFNGKTRASIGLAGYSWSNDDDLAATNKSVDDVTGFEVSGAFRSSGFSVDAQYNSFDSDLVQRGVTSGLYKNSSTTLENWSIEGGYMVIPNTLELVAGFSEQDADNYATEWTRTSIGANWFLHKNKMKVQLSYRDGSDLKGVKGADEEELFMQMQYVF
ncbi:MAG: OprO/OprP family phosphate-selective porin [Candidatus Marinimicrobia bacterium]|nr:OprO/OprP family phosphate-selective porin [Candidatus Neomarinimicrobiota bacterium]